MANTRKESILQVALDLYELGRAVQIAREAVAGGARWVEAGTPLIKSEGMNSVRTLRKEFPQAYIIADLKTMDAGRAEVEMAAKAGANCAMVLGVASESTIQECIEVSKNYGIDVAVDLLNVEDFIGLTKKVEEWGGHHVSLHCPIDDQMRGLDPFDKLKKLRPETSLPIAVAGGLNSETAATAVKSGADIVIAGGAITKSPDAKKAAAQIMKAMKSGQAVKTTLFKRGSTESDIRKILNMVSTPNISDAMHRSGELNGLIQVAIGSRCCGPAFTVRTYPGDWSKPVRAIDEAKPGDVIVVDAGGSPPAVWGELASESSLQRKISGIVIDGAIRDVDSIRKIGFSAWAKIITPTAGEPKGFGEMNVTIKVCGVKVAPGDWIVGDDSGVVVIPKAKLVEVSNRAMDVLEKENRLREEIRRKATLGTVAELEKWEKQILGKSDKQEG